MKKAIVLFAVVAFCPAGSVFALYGVINEGTWPRSWPKELEPLRKQARTLVGPVELNRHYAIPFGKRAEFESAWPYIVKVNSKRAPIHLRRGPNFFLGGGSKAGVVIHCPPAGRGEEPTSIDLNVDNLTRIPLPANTPVIDERFKDAPQGRAAGAARPGRFSVGPDAGHERTQLPDRASARGYLATDCLAPAALQWLTVVIQ